MKNRFILSATTAVAIMVNAAEPTVSNVKARQRYPWNGLVDITYEVHGIEGTTNGLECTMAVVMPNSDNARRASHFWVVQNGENSADREIHANGNYRLLWDAQADLGTVKYTNMVVRVNLKERKKVQLWEGGPYWATTNIGAEEPWEYGYYFWWGDIVGYTRENNAWVSSDGTSSRFIFSDRITQNTPTYNKDIATLQNEGWIVLKGGAYILAPEHDAAHMQWGGGWRMPTYQELSSLERKCDWTWTVMNGVNGYEVRGRGDYSSNSIFFPCPGYGYSSGLYGAGFHGFYWSSVPKSDNYYSEVLDFGSDGRNTVVGDGRYDGYSVRPVQEFVEYTNEISGGAR